MIKLTPFHHPYAFSPSRSKCSRTMASLQARLICVTPSRLVAWSGTMGTKLGWYKNVSLSSLYIWVVHLPAFYFLVYLCIWWCTCWFICLSIGSARNCVPVCVYLFGFLRISLFTTEFIHCLLASLPVYLSSCLPVNIISAYLPIYHLPIYSIYIHSFLTDHLLIC